MSDLLLDVAQSPTARALIKSLGLPIPLPERLERDGGAWTAAPLRDRAVLVGATEGAELVGALAECLAPAGADPFLDWRGRALRSVRRRPVRRSGARRARRQRSARTAKVDALVFDASGVSTAAELRALYAFFHAHARRLSRSGRVVVLGRAGRRHDLRARGRRCRARGLRAQPGQGDRSPRRDGEPGPSSRRGAEARLAAGAPLRPLPAVGVRDRAADRRDEARARRRREPVLVRSLERKIALVTGAARGIGDATARLLAQEGAHVLCLDRPADDAATSQLARDIGGTPLLVDMSAADAPARIADAAARTRRGRRRRPQRRDHARQDARADVRGARGIRSST